MISEDNNGFINFPNIGKVFDISDRNTLVYIIAFDSNQFKEKYVLSNVQTSINAEMVIDDLDGIIYDLSGEEIEGGYFIDYIDSDNRELLKSIPMVTSICVGWNNNSFHKREDGTPWYATFIDLTNEGKKLYYSIRKLHNNKEVRILTINGVA